MAITGLRKVQTPSLNLVQVVGSFPSNLDVNDVVIGNDSGGFIATPDGEAPWDGYAGSGAGWESVTRDSAGVFTVTLDRVYRQLVSWSLSYSDNGDSNRAVSLSVIHPVLQLNAAGNKSVIKIFASDGVATDQPADLYDDARVAFVFHLKYGLL